ncbi:MAG: type III-A CRISPR-associated protein Cas10/Csm1 [Phycisphaerae bacterium]
MSAVEEIALAGLLHDVGKLLQRARRPLGQETERMEQMVCPSWQGRATHRHVLGTYDFLLGLEEKWPRGVNAGRLERLAAWHHRPSDAEDWILTEADRLASGHDRRPDDAGSSKNFREVALESPLCRLCIAGKHSRTRAKWLPRPLGCDETLSPGPDVDDSSVQGGWGPLADASVRWFEEHDIRELPSSLLVQTVRGWSERFQSLVPASAMDRPDVSLHDHAVVTAALACSIWRFHEVNGNLSEQTVRDRQEKKFRFVTGSIGGIQDFIFTLPEGVGKGETRSYRAKSFYISALTEAMVQQLLSAAEMPCVCSVINAGGRFILLVDASQQTLDRILAAAADIQRWCAETQLGLLSLRIGCDLTASGADLLEGRFAQVFRAIENQAEQDKCRPESAHLHADNVWDSGGFLHSGMNVHTLLHQNHQQAAILGRQLPRCGHFGLFDSDKNPDGLLTETLDCCGLKLQIGNTDKPIPAHKAVYAAALGYEQELGWMPARPMANYVPHLTDEDVRIVEAVQKTQDENDQEQAIAGDTATFEHLALLAQDIDDKGTARGRPMLACLKADVDRLGMLTSRGFDQDVSFARVASLSRFLDLFFKGYLSFRFRQEGSPHRLVYTVFSGGDDLMLIGPWTVMFDLAAQIPAWLNRLTGDNPDVTISAALALGNPHTPTSVMAREADTALEHAKEDRNRISVFGRVFTWEQYRWGLEIGRQFNEMLRCGQDGERLGLQASFVYRTLQHARSAERTHKATRVGDTIRLSDATWRSHFLYDLHRNVEKHLQSPGQQQREDLEWLRNILSIRTDGESFAPVILGITYALYLNRGARA